MDYLGLIFRWLHVVPAALLAGGLLFCRFCLIHPERHTSFFDQDETARRRWMMLVGICSMLLLLSGVYNFYAKLVTYRLGGLYHGTWGLKLLLGLAIFYLASVLAGSSQRALRFRQREKHWLNILCILVLIVVLLGGYMKVISTDGEKKVPASNAAVFQSPAGYLLHSSLVQPSKVFEWNVEPWCMVHLLPRPPKLQRPGFQLPDIVA
jgi:hypothetical protein